MSLSNCKPNLVADAKQGIKERYVGSTLDQTDYQLRGVTCITLACVYHPLSSNDHEILQYLFESLTKVEGLSPGCAFIIAGDFKKLDTKILKRNFELKQLVRSPTCGSNILDLAFTNLHKFYSPTSVEILPLSGCQITTQLPSQSKAENARSSQSTN